MDTHRENKPGDRKNQLTNIKKIVSGSNKFSLNVIDKIYKSIIKAGTFRCETIEVAESAKIIENIQRDVNVALMNELQIVFDKLNIDLKKFCKQQELNGIFSISILD